MRLYKLKQFTIHKTWLLLVGALLFALLFFYKLKVYVSDGSGLKDFYFKIDATLDKHQDVAFYSPLNSEITFKRNDLNEYSFNTGKTAVSTIKIKGSDIGSDFYVKNAITDDWIKIDKSQISVENGVLIIKPPNSSRSFMSYFNRIFNWHGDFYMITFLLIEQLFILWLVIMIYRYRKKIALAFNTFKIDLISTCRIAFVFFVIVLLIGWLLNIQNSSYLIMSFRHPDEVPIVNRIFFNPAKFWNGFYDSQYNLLQFLFSLPGLFFNNYELVAIGNRMIATVFAGLSVVYVYKIVGLFYKHYWQNILPIVLLLTIPGFWINLNIARPDWVMTGALIVSFYFLVKDKGSLKINFWIANVIFAYACATKFHSIQYLPVFAIFWLLNFGKKDKWSLLLKMIIVFLVSFFVLNFELLTLNGLNTKISATIWELDGNSQGYGTSAFKKIPLVNKINTLRNIYANVVLIVLIGVSHIYLAYIGIKNKRYASLTALAIGNIIVGCYNILFVNKNWQNYYLTFMIIGFVVLYLSILFVFKNRKNIIVTSYLILIGLHLYVFKSIYVDIKNDYYISKQVKNEFNLQLETWNEIATLLNNSEKEELKILKSMYIAFDYLELNKTKSIRTDDIEGRKINLIYNKDLNYITSFDFIILRKYPASHINFKLSNSLNEIMIQEKFDLLFENELTRVYRYTK